MNKLKKKLLCPKGNSWGEDNKKLPGCKVHVVITKLKKGNRA